MSELDAEVLSRRLATNTTEKEILEYTKVRDRDKHQETPTLCLVDSCIRCSNGEHSIPNILA